MMKYYYKLQSKLITVLTFKNKENEWTFKIGSIIFIISLLLVFFYYFYENEFSKSTGFLKYLWFGIICAGIIVASMFVKVLNRELDNKDKVVNELKNLGYENEFKSLFTGNSFEDFKTESIKCGLISDSGKWIFSDRKRDYSILIGRLIDSKIIVNNNRKTLHLASENYFEINFDYTAMTTIINEGKKKLSAKDMETYNSFSFIDNIKV